MLVSVIIPVHNRRMMVQEAIASVITQDFQDIEIIVVDDGSDPENKMKVSRGLQQMIKYYYRLHRGVASARNFGASVAAGDYIAFLDSDDLWDKRKLSKQLAFLRTNTEYKICYTDERWFMSGAHLNQKEKHRKYGGWIFDKCLPLCIISCSSILMEKHIFFELGGFDESLPVCEDYDLWLRMSSRHPIGYLDEPLVNKRGGHPEQLSRKYWGMDRFRIQSLEKLLKRRITDGQRRLVKRELRIKYKILINGCWKHGRYFRWLYYKLKSRAVLE
ncbi:MAG: glycosyltransferase family A protein [Candidatus Margulisiibacteriota bacterium]